MKISKFVAEVEYFERCCKGKKEEEHPYLFKRLALARGALLKELDRLQAEYGPSWDQFVKHKKLENARTLTGSSN